MIEKSKVTELRNYVNDVYENAYNNWNPDGAKLLRCELWSIIKRLDEMLKD